MVLLSLQPPPHPRSLPKSCRASLASICNSCPALPLPGLGVVMASPACRSDLLSGSLTPVLPPSNPPLTLQPAHTCYSATLIVSLSWFNTFRSTVPSMVLQDTDAPRLVDHFQFPRHARPLPKLSLGPLPSTPKFSLFTSFTSPLSSSSRSSRPRGSPPEPPRHPPPPPQSLGPQAGQQTGSPKSHSLSGQPIHQVSSVSPERV